MGNRTILVETDKALCMLDEEGKTIIQIKEGKGMEIHEAFDFIEESIKAYQMKKYGHIL